MVGGGGIGRDAADKEETDEEEKEEAAAVAGVFFLKAGNVTLPLSSPPPLSCSLSFWTRSRATLTWRDGHLFLNMGTSLGAGITGIWLGGGRGERTEKDEETEKEEVVRDEAGWKSWREEEEMEEMEEVRDEGCWKIGIEEEEEEGADW